MNTHFFTYSKYIIFKRNKQENVHKWKRKWKQIIISKLVINLHFWHNTAFSYLI